MLLKVFPSSLQPPLPQQAAASQLGSDIASLPTAGCLLPEAASGYGPDPLVPRLWDPLMLSLELCPSVPSTGGSMRAWAAALHGGLEPPHPFAAQPWEAKDPINASAGSGAHDGTGEGREHRSAQIRLEKNTNYLSVTSWPAWRGAACAKTAEISSRRRRVRAAPRSREP